MEMFRKGDMTDLSDLLGELLESYNKMIGIVDDISGITKKTKLLSFNSSIEAARAGEAGLGFQVISKEIQRLAEQSDTANRTSFVTIGEMNHKINDIVGVRTADIAYDLLDKIDRNLFERNCDVQTWATFDRILNYFNEPNEEHQQAVNTLLHKLVDIHEVYLEVFMADINGNIVAAALDQSQIGHKVNTKSWFKDVITTKKQSVSDLYYSSTVNHNTIAFSAPIFNKENELIGVLSTRFNWDCVYDMLDKVKINERGNIHVINKDGLIIASNHRDEVLVRNITDTPAAKHVLGGESYGYLLQEDKNGNLLSTTGYSHSKGYRSFHGNNWSVLITEPFTKEK